MSRGGPRGSILKQPGLMKQFSAMQNRKSGGQLECYSVEDLRAAVPMKLMVNPYATRLVRDLAQFREKLVLWPQISKRFF